MATRVDVSDYVELIKRIRGLGDKKLQRRLNAKLRRATGPMGRRIIEAGARKMPRHGGLAHLVFMNGRASTSLLPGGVRLNLRNRSASLSALNRGILRHPVFARTDKTRDEWKWISQDVPAEAFSDALADMSDEASAALKIAMDEVARELG